MSGTIMIGTMAISVDAAYKGAVLGILGTIAASLAYIVYWIST